MDIFWDVRWPTETGNESQEGPAMIGWLGPSCDRKTLRDRIYCFTRDSGSPVAGFNCDDKLSYDFWLIDGNKISIANSHFSCHGRYRFPYVLIERNSFSEDVFPFEQQHFLTDVLAVFISNIFSFCGMYNVEMFLLLEHKFPKNSVIYPTHLVHRFAKKLFEELRPPEFCSRNDAFLAFFRFLQKNWMLGISESEDSDKVLVYLRKVLHSTYKVLEIQRSERYRVFWRPYGFAEMQRFEKVFGSDADIILDVLKYDLDAEGFEPFFHQCWRHKNELEFTKENNPWEEQGGNQ